MFMIVTWFPLKFSNTDTNKKKKIFNGITFYLYQRELDAEVAGMGQRQDESEAARKQLIELSREFKRTATEVRKKLHFSFYLGEGMKMKSHRRSLLK